MEPIKEQVVLVWLTTTKDFGCSPGSNWIELDNLPCRLYLAEGVWNDLMPGDQVRITITKKPIDDRS